MSDYIRHTKRNKFGNADIVGVNSGELFKNLSNVQGIQLCEALNYFAELEDKIENGMLIELPCKVGDTVYFTDRNNENLTVENDILKSEKENAVKEFAEKVKKYSYTDNCFTDGKWHRYVLVSDIDELLKEYEK